MIEPERRAYIRQISAGLLLLQDSLTGVIDVRDMNLPETIHVVSFDEYAKLTGLSRLDLTQNGAYDDGYTVVIGQNKLVLYNPDYDVICPQRLRFSLAHEIGHIFLNHDVDDSKNEEEANYFASQIVAHDAIAVSMLTGKWSRDLNFIREQFGISWDTASIKLKFINRNKRAYCGVEYQLFMKYKHLFSTRKYSRSKFATDSSIVFAEFDDTYA